MNFFHASRPKRGETFCGDAVGVFGAEGRRLFAVTDGLGHGPEAHAASERVLEVLAAVWEKDLESIVWECHDRLRDTRGVAFFLCRFTDGEEKILECAGIGNVECKAVGDVAIAPFPRDGIVGHRVRKVSSFRYPYKPDSVLAVFTDGIHSGFDLEAYAAMEPAQAAQEILDRFGKDWDDATVLVIKT